MIRVRIPAPTHTHTWYFPEIHVIEIVWWSFVVVETSENSHSITNWKGPMAINSQNTSNQYFEITILFSVVERSRNYVFENNTPPPHSPQCKGCKLCPKSILGFSRKVGRINSGGGLIGLEIICSSSLFKGQSDWGHPLPLPALYFQKCIW